MIGAGLGGIAAALRLRHRGYRVTLIEQLDQLGGRATVTHRNGYTFDMGPTVITAKFLFDELFELFGKKREDYVKFVDVFPWYRVQFSDGTFFDYGGTIEQMLEQIRKFNPDDCTGYLKFLDHSKRIFDVGFTKLGDKPFNTIGSMIKAMPDMVRWAPGERFGVWRASTSRTKSFAESSRFSRCWWGEIRSIRPVFIR